MKAGHTLALSGKVQELSERLEKAVREEKYEDAAQLRDELSREVFERLMRRDEQRFRTDGSARRSLHP